MTKIVLALVALCACSVDYVPPDASGQRFWEHSTCHGLCNPCSCSISAGGNPTCECGEDPFANLQCQAESDCGFASRCPAPNGQASLIANAFAFCSQGLHGWPTFGQCVTAQVEGFTTSCEGGFEP